MDAAFVVLPTKSNEFEEQLIYEGHFVACLPEHHRLKDEKEITLEQLKDDDWILFDSTFALRQIVLDSCLKEGFVPNIAYSTTQWDLLIALVREGLGVAIVPSPLVKMSGHKYVSKRLVVNIYLGRLALYVKKNRYKTHALQAFLETVNEIYN